MHPAPLRRAVQRHEGAADTASQARRASSAGQPFSPIKRELSAPRTAPRETSGVRTPSLTRSGHRIRAPPPSRDSRRARRTRPGRAPASLAGALYSSQILTTLIRPSRAKLRTRLPRPSLGRSGSFWYRKKALELYFQLQTSEPSISLVSGSENGIEVSPHETQGSGRPDRSPDAPAGPASRRGTPQPPRSRARSGKKKSGHLRARASPGPGSSTPARAGPAASLSGSRRTRWKQPGAPARRHRCRRDDGSRPLCSLTEFIVVVIIIIAPVGRPSARERANGRLPGST